MKPTDNQENECPNLETISEDDIVGNFGQSTGLTDRTNFSYGFNWLLPRVSNVQSNLRVKRPLTIFPEIRAGQVSRELGCNLSNKLNQRRPKSIDSMASPTNEPIKWPQLDPQLCSAIMQPFFRVLKNNKIKELLTYDRCW